MNKILAAIDLGSNSFHMSIVKITDSKNIEILTRIKNKVQLRFGIDNKENLTKKAQDKAINCLTEFKQIIDQYKTTDIIAIGTYTLRKAHNIDEFLAKASKILNHDIRIVSGTEEARLIYLGATHDHSVKKKALIIDIGGGSTELIIGDDNDLYLSKSLEMGCVSFEAKYFSDNLINETHFSQAIKAASKILQPHVAEFKKLGWKITLGLSGTIRSVCSILTAEHHHDTIELTLVDLLHIKQELIAQHEVSNIHIDGLLPDRSNIFPGGLSILIAIFKIFDLQSLHLSHGALREGMIRQAIENLN